MYSKIKQLFLRYQSNQAGPGEQEIVDNWFANFDDAAEKPMDAAEQSVFFAPMDRKIQSILYPRRLYTWVKAAAIIIACAGAGLFVYYRNSAQAQQITYQVIQVPNGAKKQITLPDSSVIYLNSGSSISIPSDFADKKRELSLTGEAFFIIKHNARKPFALHAGKLLIADIGTSFDVKAYPEEKHISIAVATGSVAVGKHAAGNKTTLLAGAITKNQQLVYNIQSDSQSLGKIAAVNIAAWHDDQLRFDNASFAEIASQLERWYNIKVEFGGASMPERRYTVSFNNEPVEQVMNVLTKLSGANYEIDHQTIVIHFKPTKNMN